MARKRADDYDEKRSLILKKAAECFALSGYDRASVSSVAKSCGVSKALLYHYYPSKDAILFDVIEQHLTTLLNAVSAVNEYNLSPQDYLEQLIAAILDVYRDADSEHQVQISAMGMLPKEMQQKLIELERAIVAVINGAILRINPELKAAKFITPITMSLFGILNWCYMWFQDGGAVTRDQYAKMIAQMCIGGIPSIKTEA